MKYLGYILSACVFLLAACTQELETSLLPNPNEGEGIRIALKAEDMSSIETRANGTQKPKQTAASSTWPFMPSMPTVTAWHITNRT